MTLVGQKHGHLFFNQSVTADIHKEEAIFFNPIFSQISTQFSGVI